MLSDAKLLDDDNLTTKILRDLTLCGVLIHGNWTLQSEILYPAGVVSLTNGVSSELMCRARDYVLYKFMKLPENERYLTKDLNRQKISTITQLPCEETKEVMESIAVVKICGKDKYWELHKSRDKFFEKEHPQIVHRQEALWKAQEEKFREMELEKSEKRTRKKSVRESKI